jgi:LysR family transcriptional regulator, glycine cleavage system transcriptional activator
MHKAPPPLNALRAFEAAARHLSLTRAAQELNVTASALSHQIRGLEDHLGVRLFDRGVRSVALTEAGRQLYPGLQTGFGHIREAVESLDRLGEDHVLVVSTAPGFTAKWLAPRLYRFSAANPDIDVRISSTLQVANFTSDGVDVAIRNLTRDAPADRSLFVERLIDQSFLPVCSPGIVEKFGPFAAPGDLRRAPLIHDDTYAGRSGMPAWADWFAAAGASGADISRGLRFNSADHALDATVEGAGILLAHAVLAHDDLRSGRLVVAFDHSLPSTRAYCFVCPANRRDQPKVRAFHAWLRAEFDALDWRSWRKDA